MKIAVLSDIHDHIWNLTKALEKVKEEKCQALIFCGDFCAPFIAPHLVETGLPVYACFGNNDEDQLSIVEQAKSDKFQVWAVGKEFAEIELDGIEIAFCHYPKLGQLLAKTGDYQAVFHGHTHEAYQEKIGNTLLANPGAICGIISGQYGPASFGVYDTHTHSFEHIYLFK
jgi:putative phosphoesterase